jgi:hypothetical protein
VRKFLELFFLKKVFNLKTLTIALEFPAKSFSHDHFASVEVQTNQSEENKKIAS